MQEASWATTSSPSFLNSSHRAPRASFPSLGGATRGANHHHHLQQRTAIAKTRSRCKPRWPWLPSTLSHLGLPSRWRSSESDCSSRCMRRCRTRRPRQQQRLQREHLAVCHRACPWVCLAYPTSRDCRVPSRSWSIPDNKISSETTSLNLPSQH